MESVAVWQGLALSGIFSWIVITSYFNVTKKIRSLVQPCVAHHVVTGTSTILKIQVWTKINIPKLSFLFFFSSGFLFLFWF